MFLLFLGIDVDVFLFNEIFVGGLFMLIIVILNIFVWKSFLLLVMWIMMFKFDVFL